jgi:cytidylate kinase
VIIAVDGPAGAGKSTVARAVARALGWDYLDTGAMYRAVALRVLETGVAPNDGDAAAEIARAAEIVATDNVVLLDGRDVSDRIRDDDVTAAVPAVSALPGVRRAMVAVQRSAARRGDVVIEGRDIGTNVAPEAEVKVFLTASPQERARRRVRQQGLHESPQVLDEVGSAIIERDKLDSSRRDSPLVQDPDAVLIDSTHMSVDEVVAAIVSLVDQKAPK